MIIAIIQSINSLARRNISTIIKFKRRGGGGEREHENRGNTRDDTLKIKLASFHSFFEEWKIVGGLAVFLFSNNSLDPPSSGMAVAFNAKFIATTPRVQCSIRDENSCRTDARPR